MPETALYPVVKRFLEGFEVKGEGCGCDIVAVRHEEPPRPAIVEMKLGFSLDLLLQFGRIRTLVKYGMTAAQVAKVYRVAADEIARILRQA